MLLALTDPPLRLMEVAPAVGENVPPHVLLKVNGLATCMPLGNESVKATPVMATLLPVGLVIVMVRVEVPPGKVMVVGLNDLLTVGGARKLTVAVFDVVPVPPLVELTLPVVLL